jgi:hypothetical protein
VQKKQRRTNNPVLTEEMLAGLEPKPARYTVWDSVKPGLGLRVQPTGIKTFVYQRRPEGSSKPVTVTLGRYGDISLDDARLEVKDTRRVLDAGKNPTDIARQTRGKTVGKLAEQFVDEVLSELRQGRQCESYLRRHWLDQTPHHTKHSNFSGSTWETTWTDDPRPRFRDKPAASIERDDILAKLKEVQKADSKYAARHALDAVRRFFNWAAQQPHVGFTVSPAAGLVDSHVGLSAKGMRRKRTLSDGELHAVWQATADPTPFNIGVRLLLLTGARRNDIFKAKRREMSDIGDGCRMISVPPERFKTDEHFEIVLGPKAVELVEALPQFKGCPWLISQNGGKPIGGFSKPKARLDKASGVGLIEPVVEKGRVIEPGDGWTLHDLRRTVRSRLRPLGVSRDTAEQVLGHAMPGLDETYDVSTYRPEKLDALLRWEKALLAIVEPKQPAPSNVVRLPERPAA